VTWLGNYRASTPGTTAADNATVRLDLDNELQPVRRDAATVLAVLARGIASPEHAAFAAQLASRRTTPADELAEIRPTPMVISVS